MATVKTLETHKHPKHPRLTLHLRSDSQFYQARTYLDGKLRHQSTKTANMRTAFKLADDWYQREVRASAQFGHKHPVERITANPTVSEVFTSYKTSLERKKRPEADKRWGPIADFWRTLYLSEVRPQTFRDFYTWRRKRLKTITAHTLHKDIVCIRQILKYATEQEMLEQMPIIPKPGKIEANPRPWLTPDEWEHLKGVSQKRIEEAKGNRKLHQQRVDTDDFMRFMVSSMTRVDEALNLRFRDCRVRLAQDLKQLLFCTVNGKRGLRDLETTPEAVEIVTERVGGPDDFVFPAHHRDAFRELLIAAKLRQDKDGFTRNFKSLRATSISFAVLAGEDVVWISKNAGTSITMINDFYCKRLSALNRVQKSHPIEVPVRS